VAGLVESMMVVLRVSKAPRSVTLAGQPLASFEYAAEDPRLWIRFTKEARARELAIEF
jgi:hypothetical protein